MGAPRVESNYLEKPSLVALFFNGQGGALIEGLGRSKTGLARVSEAGSGLAGRIETGLWADRDTEAL